MVVFCRNTRTARNGSKIFRSNTLLLLRILILTTRTHPSADAILFATHSQGSIVTTHLVDRLISDGHIRTPKTSILDSALSRPAPKVIVLALCGIHNGPLLYLNTSSIVNPYIQVKLCPFAAFIFMSLLIFVI